MRMDVHTGACQFSVGYAEAHSAVFGSGGSFLLLFAVVRFRSLILPVPVSGERGFFRKAWKPIGCLGKKSVQKKLRGKNNYYIITLQ